MTAQDPELSAALGWPGGISDPVLDRTRLLQMVAALRLASQQALEALEPYEQLRIAALELIGFAWHSEFCEWHEKKPCSCGYTETYNIICEAQKSTFTPDVKVEPASKMTAGRAAYFMARFKREEKMLGPNEQAALDFVISMLEAALAEPEPAPTVEFDHGIGADRFKVVRGAYWWHILIGDSPIKRGKFHTKAGAEEMVVLLLREFRNGAFVQHNTAPPQRKPLTEEEIDRATAQARDALLDHIYEYSTTTEGVLERIRNLCRAVEKASWEKNHGQA